MKSRKNFRAKAQLRLLIFLGVLLSVFVIPLVTVYVTKQKTSDRSNATASTTLTFTALTSQVPAGQNFSTDVNVNPGNNLVTFIKLVINYDSSVITAASNSAVPNTTAFPTTLDGPTNTCTGTQCTLTIQLSIGPNPTNAIAQTTKVATINFQAVANGTTQVTFDNQTQVLSIAPSDLPSENVLSTTTPLTITVGNGSGITPGNSPTPQLTHTPSSGDLIFSLMLALPGIGANGGNTHPLHPARKAYIVFYNLDTGEIFTKDEILVFDGKYFIKPQFDMGKIPPGNYEIFARSPFTLTTRLSQVDGTSTFVVPDQNSTTNTQPFIVPASTLILGDVAPSASLKTFGDDILDLLDYNTVINCYKHNSVSATCTNIQGADLDDNGLVDGIDYNILLRGFSITRSGDPVPVAPANTGLKIK